MPKKQFPISHMSSVWNLIKDGRFDEAAALAEQQHAQTNDISPLRNGVLARLNLGDIEGAIEWSQRAVRISNGDTDSDFIFLGVSYWASGKRVEALSAWRDGMPSAYTDAAGGLEPILLQYFAAVANQDKALVQSLRTLLKKRQFQRSPNWPSPLAGYVLKETDLETLSRSMSSSPIMRAKQICQASFYSGVAAWEALGKEQAKPFFLEAVAQGPVTLTKQEFYLAKHELSALDKTP